MSLYSYIEWENWSQEELESVMENAECPQILGIEWSPRRKWFGLIENTKPYLRLFLHQILTDKDSDDLDNDFWDMEQSGLDALAEFMQLFAKRIGKNFSMMTVWDMEDAQFEKEVTVPELVQIIKSGKIGTKIRYMVKVD